MELTRREFLKIGCMAAATLALGGCGLPVHQALVSQLDMPEYRLPGDSRWFATSCGECGDGCGVSVRVADGRAKKIEGIATHPINHGKVCAKGQSALQALYNPDRLTEPLKKNGEQFVPAGNIDDLVKEVAGQLNAMQGSSLWITNSLRGTTGALIASLSEAVGAKLWVLDYPGTYMERAVMKTVSGHSGLHYLNLKDADYVVNFGSDFLGTGNSTVNNNWGYGEFRQGSGRKRGIMVSFSSRMNMTVASSDRWIPVSPGYEGWVALGVGNIIAESGKKGWPDWAKSVSLEDISKNSGVTIDIMNRLAKKLLEAKKPLAIGGSENGAFSNGAFTLWAVQSLNKLLTGKIESYEQDLLVPLPGEGKIGANIVSTKEAVSSLQDGKFQTVWVLDANPVYLLPSKLEIEKLLQNVKNKIAFTPFMNETSAMADLVFPTQSWLEEWNDSRVNGPFGHEKNISIYGLRQPVVEPGAGSISIGDALLKIAMQSSEPIKKKFQWGSIHELLKSRFNHDEWETSLGRAGVWEEYNLDWEPYLTSPAMYPPVSLASKGKAPAFVSVWEHVKPVKVSGVSEPQFDGEGLVLIPFVSNSLHDGSIANRPWMQELPDPMTTAIWGDWVEINENVAKEKGIERGDIVRVTSSSGSIELPAIPSPGIHTDAVAIPVGTGHKNYGRFANHGNNPLSIISPAWQDHTGEIAWVSTRVKIEKTDKKGTLVTFDKRVGGLHREAIPHH